LLGPLLVARGISSQKRPTGIRVPKICCRWKEFGCRGLCMPADFMGMGAWSGDCLSMRTPRH